MIFPIYLRSFRTELMLVDWEQGLGTPVLQPCGRFVYKSSIASQPRQRFPILHATSQLQSLPLAHRT